MRAPVAVYIDDRVAGSLATEKDLELAERGIEQAKYIRDDVVQRLVRDAAGHAPEFLVQIHDMGGLMFGLTNTGRLFSTDLAGPWEEIPGPQFPDGLSG